MKEHPDDARAYRLLSLAEETMLDGGWLRDHGLDDAAVASVRAALDDRGAYSDLQVYYNVVRG